MILHFDGDKYFYCLYNCVSFFLFKRYNFFKSVIYIIDIPMWLKSLRLHKYAHIFTDVTYEEMMSFGDDYLDKQGVTKGARNKILLCIQKLKDRKETLEQLEKVMIFFKYFCVHLFL